MLFDDIIIVKICCNILYALQNTGNSIHFYFIFFWINNFLFILFFNCFLVWSSCIGIYPFFYDSSAGKKTSFGEKWTSYCKDLCVWGVEYIFDLTICLVVAMLCTLNWARQLVYEEFLIIKFSSKEQKLIY